MNHVFRGALMLTLGVSVLLTSLPCGAQDFDPSGRSRRHRLKPVKPSSARGRSAARKKQSLNARIARYTAIVLAKPHEQVPLRKLFELYRKRDGSTRKLIGSFEKKARQSQSSTSDAHVALAAIYIEAKRDRKALKLLTGIANRDRRHLSSRLLLAKLAERKGQLRQTSRWLKQALRLVNKDIERERLHRRLMVLSVDLGDIAAAKKHHRALVRLAKGSAFVRRELGDELFRRKQYVKATEAYRAAVRAARGDHRSLAPALAKLGHSLAKQGAMDEALKTLRQARKLAAKRGGVRNQILALMTTIFRERGELKQLITLLESEKATTVEQMTTLASLYEEVGRVDNAIAQYKRVLRKRRGSRDVRVKLVALLQAAGRLDEAVRQYEALIRSAPDEPEYVFELARTLLQRGERRKALDHVTKLERASRNKRDTLMAIADFYESIDEGKRAINLLERIVKKGGGDPQAIIDLGDRYFQAGDIKRAKRTWLRLVRVVPDKARAASLLGEVYLDHDMATQALRQFRRAVKLQPSNRRHIRKLASALERAAPSTGIPNATYREALDLWQGMLAKHSNEPLIARECRTHIVSLWSVLRVLPQKVGPLMTATFSTPPDLQAARLLAEVQRRLRRFADAERTLRLLHKMQPQDAQTLLNLERVLVMQRKLSKAIDTLQALTQLDPKRASTYLQRMANYASELYRDDDALAFASRAVALSSGDGRGHYRLAQMHRRRRNSSKALLELRRAIKKNPRLFVAYFDLAEMLVSKGQVSAANELYTRVIRSSRDDAYVRRATQLSVQLNLGRGALESVERVLLPLTLANPKRPLFRKLLVEVYGSMTLPLVHKVKFGRPEEARKARATLATIGSRAVKPLLDALGDKDRQQRSIGLDVLSYVKNPSAGAALFNFATGDATRALRTRAMLACGALDDSAMAERLANFLQEAKLDAPRDSITTAAAWGLARSGAKRHAKTLTRLLLASNPDIRALAALGLGRSKATAQSENLSTLARESQDGPLPRAAAIVALGLLGGQLDEPLMLGLTESPNPRVQRASLVTLAWHLARRDKTDSATAQRLKRHLADALFSTDTHVQASALQGASALFGKQLSAAAIQWELPTGTVDVTGLVDAQLDRKQDPRQQLQALVALQPYLMDAASTAVATSPKRARVVAEVLSSGWSSRIGGATEATRSPSLRHQLKVAQKALAGATLFSFVGLAKHPDSEVRKLAIDVLARNKHPDAQKVVADALQDDDDSVRSMALAAARHAEARVLSRTAKLLTGASRWSVRALAARTLGRLSVAASAAGTWTPSLQSTLKKAAVSDEFALVREAGIVALAMRPERNLKVLKQRAEQDPEPRVRQRARKAIEDARRARPQ